MVDLMSTASSFLPSGSTVSTIIMWIIVVVVIGMIIGLGAWWFINKQRYARIIRIYELRNGVPQEIGEDRARIINIDAGLAKIWYLKKLKIYTQPLIYSCKKLTYPCIRKADGDLVNFELKLDESGRQIIGSIMPTSLRMANANIRRYFREAYKNESFMQKWGGMIVFTGSIVIICLVFVYILGEVAKIIPALQQVADTLAKALASVKCTAVSNGQTVVSS